MSKDDKAGPVKNEAELELEELAAEEMPFGILRSAPKGGAKCRFGGNL